MTSADAERFAALIAELNRVDAIGRQLAAVNVRLTERLAAADVMRGVLDRFQLWYSSNRIEHPGNIHRNAVDAIAAYDKLKGQ